MNLGRSAVVIGVTSGIGKAVAEGFILKGIPVTGNARRAEVLEMMTHDLSPKGRALMFVGVAGDATQNNVLENVVEKSKQAFSMLPDIFVLCAGRGLPGTVVTSDESKWEELFRINCLGTIRQMRIAAQVLLEGRKNDGENWKPRDIVVIGSSIGRNISPFNPVYGSTKFAVHSAAEALRQELGPQGIRVSLIEPGIVKTEFQQAANYDPAWFQQYEKQIGPILVAQDVANLVQFIVSQPPHVHLNDIVIRPTRQPYP